jgi:hypothetical protein
MAKSDALTVAPSTAREKVTSTVVALVDAAETTASASSTVTAKGALVPPGVVTSSGWTPVGVPPLTARMRNEVDVFWSNGCASPPTATALAAPRSVPVAISVDPLATLVGATLVAGLEEMSARA